MSYLLETLGRGLLGRLLEAFHNQLPIMPEDSIESLTPRVRVCPGSIDLGVRLGLCYLREQRVFEARDVLERLVREAPHSQCALLSLACVYEELGLTDIALQTLLKAADNDPNDPAVAFSIGMIQEHRGERDQARLHYTQAARLCPRLRNAFERLAALSVRDADWTGAIENYRTLVDLEPNDLDLQLALAALYLQAGFPEHAVDAFQRALLIEPECNDEELADADEKAGAGRLHDAITEMQELVAQYPGAPELHVHLADLYVKTGADGRAVHHYEAALELHPGFVEATVKLGTQHLRCGRWAEAARAFNSAVELNDRLVTAFVGLGFAQHACGRLAESTATLDLAASLEPNSGLLLSESARLYMRACGAEQAVVSRGPACDDDCGADDVLSDDLLTEALRRHQRGLILAPGRADLRYRYGMLLRQLGHGDRALDEFRQAVAIDPTFTRALLKLGLALRQQGDQEEGLKTLRSAILLQPHNVQTHYQLALLFTQPARFHLALDRFQHVGLSSRSAFEHNLSLALQNVGLLDRAASTWRALCEISRTALRCEDRISLLSLAGGSEGAL
jgi:tetratricopeptide (TPR) repeat protein